MRALNINLPDSLVAKMEELSKKDGISLEYFVSLAVAEKISSWVTDGLIQDRAKRANKEKYLQVLKDTYNMKSKELSEIEEIVKEKKYEFVREWKKYFSV